MLEEIELSPDEPVFSARSLDALIQKWLDWTLNDLGEMDSVGNLRSVTVGGYASKIAYFRRWWVKAGPALNYELREPDFITFNRWLTTKSGLSYNSRKDVLRRLSQMFKWACEKNHTKRDYSSWLPDADGSAPLRTPAPIAALHQLIQAAGQSDNPRRNQAILAIVIGTGMRRSECASLRIEDIALAADGSGTITIHRAKRVRNRDVQGRIVIFNQQAGRYIRSYLDALARNDGPLFPGRWREKPMRPESLDRIVAGLIADVGLKGQIQNLHDLRRLFITYFRRNRKGEQFDRLLRMQVGHASAAMTDHYDLSGVEALRDDLIDPFGLMEADGLQL